MGDQDIFECNVEMMFGKYKGRTLRQIMDADPVYIAHLLWSVTDDLKSLRTRSLLAIDPDFVQNVATFFNAHADKVLRAVVESL